MRGRSDTNEETARPTGPITDQELDEVREAYAAGRRGEILIGLRGGERVITMLLPARPDSIGEPSAVPERILQALRAIGCDRCQRIGVSP